MEVKQQQDSNRLSPNFIAELCKSCLISTKVTEICIRYLKYEYLENNAQKEVFRYINNTFSTTSTLPTVGVIAQNFSANKDVIAFLNGVKSMQINKESVDMIVSQLEHFIKHARFVEVYNNVHSMYQEGKREQAIQYMAKESSNIDQFAIKEQYFSRVFGDYQHRQQKRISNAISSSMQKTSKIPTGIRELDEITLGGWKRKTSALFLGQSGQGKTTALRWCGISAARAGFKVVHFQIEGSEEECLQGYDAAWTGTSMRKFDEIEFTGSFEQSEEIRQAIEKARKSIVDEYKGEVIVYAAESFDNLTIEKAREILKEIVATLGDVDLVIFDYLEVMETSTYKNVDERKRREKLANFVTNIAIEFNCASLTATQASDINPKDLVNPDFVMTRHHISEFKGCLKPFSYFITLNATPAEYKEDIMRLYCDKFRRHKAGQTITIAQAKESGRFYENKRTMEKFYKAQTSH